MSLSFIERIHPDRFWRGEKPDGDEIVLSHRRIFILPTKAGLLCGILLGVMLLASIVYNNSLGFVLTFLLAGISLVSIFHTFRALTGLSVTAGKRESVFAGDSACCVFQVRNVSSFPRAQVSFQLQNEKPVRVDLPADTTVFVELEKSTDRRGPVSTGTLTVSSIYPLGLFRAWSPLRFRKQLLVYPRPADQHIDLFDASASSDGNEISTADGDDFIGLRSYQNGESRRRIHWKSVAKQQGVFTRLYVGELDSDLWIDIDRIGGDSLEEQLSILCRMILDAERSGLCYGLRLPGFLKAPDSGCVHQADCLRALGMFQFTDAFADV